MTKKEWQIVLLINGHLPAQQSSVASLASGSLIVKDSTWRFTKVCFVDQGFALLASYVSSLHQWRSGNHGHPVPP